MIEPGAYKCPIGSCEHNVVLEAAIGDCLPTARGTCEEGERCTQRNTGSTCRGAGYFHRDVLADLGAFERRQAA